MYIIKIIKKLLKLARTKSWTSQNAKFVAAKRCSLKVVLITVSVCTAFYTSVHHSQVHDLLPHYACSTST